MRKRGATGLGTRTEIRLRSHTRLLVRWLAAALLAASIVTPVIGASAATTGQWVVTGNNVIPDRIPQAVLLDTGKVLVAGGLLTLDADTAELYDPAAGAFSMTGKMSFPRSCCFTLTRLLDGTVLAAGGYSNFGEVTTKTADLYDPSTGTWSKVHLMTQQRNSAAAALLADGRVLVAGGHVDARPPTATAEIYDPATRSFSPTGSMTVPRMLFSLTTLPDGRILAAGGSDGTNILASAELYDPATGTWTPTESLRIERFDHTATRLRGGNVLVAGGGSGSPETPTATSEIYHPHTGRWTPGGKMDDARQSATATALPDGTVLVAGGVGSSFSNLSTAEIYQPQTHTWSFTMSMHAVRREPASVLLPSGPVLVVGGTDQPAELYIPGT